MDCGRGQGKRIVGLIAFVGTMAAKKRGKKSGVKVVMFELSGGPRERQVHSSGDVPKMTADCATLVSLMNRYLYGLLDPFITLLEVHKLMYFMQLAGEPLRLKYRKARYGPYAENLRHVLHAVEGHWVFRIRRWW